MKTYEYQNIGVWYLEKSWGEQEAKLLYVSWYGRWTHLNNIAVHAYNINVDTLHKISS